MPSPPVAPFRFLLLVVASLFAMAGPAAAAQFTSIAPGLNHTCAIKADHTLWCWGEGRQGQVGIIGTVRARTPLYVIGSYQAGQVSSGQAFFCQRLLDGGASCSGRAERGQIGNGSTSPAQFAQDVALDAVSKVAAGAATACAIHGAGTVACWGDGIRGQLGNGRLVEGPNPTPVEVPNLARIVDLDVGETHVCAARADGAVLCWGDTQDGKLGNEIRSAITVPGVAVKNLTGARAVAVGDRHSCALRANGTVACWGANASGQLGNGSTAPSGSAVAVAGLTGVTGIAAAGLTTCAVKGDGTAWCWGDGTAGQIGDGGRANALRPTRVAGITDAAQIAVSSRHACLVTTSQAPFCWGSNASGQLGTGAPLSATATRPQLVQDFILGAATFLPASLPGTVPAGSTAGGVLQFNALRLPRRGKSCPKRASLRITARGRSSTRRVSPVKVSRACVLSGRYLLPRRSENATKATYRITGDGLKGTRRTLRARQG